MKTIGLLGGTSWPSTIDYYRTLNEMVSRRLGGNHSAKLKMWNIDYHEIKSRYGARWNEVAALLKNELETLAEMKPDCMVICNNTLHKALDEITSEPVFEGIPVIHIVDEAGKAARNAGYNKIFLLGTKFTMEDGFYARRLAEKFKLAVDIPSESHRLEIQTAQTGLANGESPYLFKENFRTMLANYSGYDAVVLACTELPLAISQKNSPLPVLNPTFLQCSAAVDFALDL